MPDLASKEFCTGCSACVSTCPVGCLTMQTDPDGFSYPELTAADSCLSCGACERVCPVLAEKRPGNTAPLAFAACSEVEDLRADSSSGGIFSEIALRVLDRGGVVYGAAYDDDFFVRHARIEQAGDLARLRGAKYAESRLGDTFREVAEDLRQGRAVLFSGTPCQVAGLRAFLGDDTPGLVCVDFVCHGIPAPVAWREFLRFRAGMDAGGALPVYVNLRSKHTGWSRYRYSNVIRYATGKEYSSVSGQSLFMSLFVRDYISRPSCGTCRFKGYERVSDITLGDFWGIWDIAPEMDDDRGTSVVLLHTENGRTLWAEITGRIRFREVSLEEASRQNPSMLRASPAKENRAEVLSMIRAGKIGACGNVLSGGRSPVGARLKNQAASLVRKLRNR